MKIFSSKKLLKEYERLETEYFENLTELTKVKEEMVYLKEKLRALETWNKTYRDSEDSWLQKYWQLKHKVNDEDSYIKDKIEFDSRKNALFAELEIYKKVLGSLLKMQDCNLLNNGGEK